MRSEVERVTAMFWEVQKRFPEMGYRDFARECGVSSATISQLAGGIALNHNRPVAKPYRPRPATLAKIETGLRRLLEAPNAD